MITYRFVWLDEKGHPPKSTHIECATATQAIEIAQYQTGDYAAIEIWNGGQRICRCGNPDKVKRDSAATPSATSPPRLRRHSQR
jgi:hypothetical protein